MRLLGILALAVGCGLAVACLIPSASAAPPQQNQSGSSLQADALRAFRQNRFDDVVRLLEEAPEGHPLSSDVLRAGVRSAVRAGRHDMALTLYARLVPPGKPDEAGLLKDVAFAIITRHVRDPQEHLRIAAYLTLTDIATRDAIALFEDGLLDSSVMVRARAVEGLARAGSPAAVAALARALDDPAPSVRIAALNALGTRVDPRLRSTFIRLSKSE
ncbi:MAG TPA: HEAT repeat domain-containing protein, partial [Nitrospiraceae bacterium]|nr:HEAT repeat domain-containing protein [Nitrospiraceae bacterium]